MSRIMPEAQRRSYSSESWLSHPGEVHALPPRTGWAWHAGWDFWVVRTFLIACTGAVRFTLGPFGLHGLPAAGVGLLIALVVLLAELRLRRAGLGAVRCGGGEDGAWGISGVAARPGVC